MKEFFWLNVPRINKKCAYTGTDLVILQQIYSDSW